MNPLEARWMLQLAVGGVLLMVTAWLYSFGGREGSPGRRVRVWGAGLSWPIGLLLLAVWSQCQSWSMLLGIILYPTALSLPTNARWQRGVAGVVLGGASFAFLLPIGLVWIGMAQVTMAILAHLTLAGTTGAASEEWTRWLVSVCLVAGMVIR